MNYVVWSFVILVAHSTYAMEQEIERLPMHERCQRPLDVDGDPYPTYKNNALRIMGYNIYHDFKHRRGTEIDWQFRKAPVAQDIRDLMPDVVALAESTFSQTQELLEELPGEYASYGLFVDGARYGTTGNYSHDMDQRKFLYDNAFLVRQDTTYVQKDGHFWVVPDGFEGDEQDYDCNPRIVQEWDDNNVRYVNWLRIDHAASTIQVTIFEHHASGKPKAKLASSLIIKKKMQEVIGKHGKLPAVLVGDFNTFKDDASGQEMYNNLRHTEFELHDVRDNPQYPHHGPDHTWLGWEDDPFKGTSARIDHQFYTDGLCVVDEGVIMPPQDGKRRSDHVPTCADYVCATN